jgi:hypothetical protein
LSDIPAGWKSAALTDLTSPERSTVPAYESGRPYVGLEHVEARSTKVVGTGDSKAIKSAVKPFLPGYTLYARLRPYLNKVCAPEFEGVASAEFLVFGPRPWLAPRYLLYLFNSPTFVAFANHNAEGIERPRISWPRMGGFPAALPPLNEQRRIVAAIEEHLSRLDAADESLPSVLQRIDVLRSALITSLVENGDWPRSPWRVAGESQNGRAFPSRDYSETGIKLLRPGNLHDSGTVDWDAKNTRRLPESYAEEHPRFIIGEHELVMNLTAQSLKDEFLGRVCLTQAGERCLLNQRIARLTPNDADPRFVMYAFKSRRFRAFVNGLNKGSLIQHMFTSQLAEYELPLPPLEEQRRIVQEVEERLSRIDAMRASIERAQRRSAALRAAILERAFRGELVPQDPADEPAEALLARIRASIDS